MRKIVRTGWLTVFCLLAVAMVCAPNPGAAKEIELNFISFVPLKSYDFAMWKPIFIDRINEKAKGELKITVRGGPEAIPIFDQAMAVKNGVVDFMFTASGFFTSVIPGIDSYRLSEISAAEERKNGAYDYIGGMCEKAGFKYLGRVLTTENKGIFWFFAKKKLEKQEDFKGLKVGCSPAFHSFLKGLGSTAVTLGITDYYTAMERGVVDGLTTTVGTAAITGLHEVSKFAIDHPYYATTSPLLFNLQKWNSLPPHLQKLIEQTAIEQENEWPAIRAREEAKSKEQMVKAGVQFYTLSPEMEKWYYQAAYDFAWEEDAKKYPPDVVNALKGYFRKK